MKKSVFLSGLLILLLEMTGCQSLQNSSQTQASTGQVQSSSAENSSAAPSSEIAASSSAAVQSSSAISPVSSAVKIDQPQRTQQEVLKQTKAALKTKVPQMLPTNLPVEKGLYLAAVTASRAQSYKVDLYEVKQPAAINSKAASKGTLIATVEGTAYQNASSAKDSISGYEKADVSATDQILDLGHKIKAVKDAGLGHQILTWNEGRWCLRVDSPTDPTYKNKKYPDRDRLAKDVVAYLEDHMLPAPHEIGVISIHDWGGNHVDSTTTVNLQQNKAVYSITCTDPMVALKVAVAMR